MLNAFICRRLAATLQSSVSITSCLVGHFLGSKLLDRLEKVSSVSGRFLPRVTLSYIETGGSNLWEMSTLLQIKLRVLQRVYYNNGNRFN
jgi:hypothetical protein